MVNKNTKIFNEMFFFVSYDMTKRLKQNRTTEETKDETENKRQQHTSIH